MATQTLAHGFKGHVLIIGGGIGGNSLALFLKNAGISSTVYEAYAYQDAVGGGLGLAPNGMNVLAALELAEEVKARGTLNVENCFYNQHGRTLARYKNGTVKQYGQPGVSLTRASLHDILTQAAKKQGIQIEYEKRLKTVTSEGDKVVAHFEDGTQARGDLLIGADGIHSKTRETVFPDAPKPAYVGIIGIGGFVPAAAVPPMTLREKQSFCFTFGANGFFGYCGGDKGDMMWWSNMQREKELTREQLADLSLEKIKQEMLTIYKGYHEPIQTLIRNTTTPFKINISDIQSLPTWHKGRVVLIGDAAHAVSPNAGQGASMALEDAMYLGKLLAQSASYEQVFEQFEQARKPRVERIVAEGRRRGDDKLVVTPLQSKIRDVMLMIFMNLFGEKGQDWLYSYKVS